MSKFKEVRQRIEEQKFFEIAETLVESLNQDASIEAITKLVEAIDIESYRKSALVEYLDKNKDKLLAMATYTEGDPVSVGDDYEPHARKNGKVVSKGAIVGSYRVKFDDGEYDIPAHHLTRQDAVATEACEPKDEPLPEALGEKDNIMKKIMEQKCLALLSDGTLVKLIVEDVDNSDEIIAEQIQHSVLVVFPEIVTESFTQEIQEELTDEQQAKREEIVLGLKKNSADLKKRYGDRWESVMYAIATKKAMGESLAEASTDIVYKKQTARGLVTISKDASGYFTLKHTVDGKVDSVQDFSDFKEAEKEVEGLL